MADVELDLEGSMDEIFDELEKEEDVEEVEEIEEVEEPEEAEEETEEPEAPAAKEAAKPAEAAPVEAEEPLEPRLNVPPTTWTAEAKSKYNALPGWAKKEIHKREEDAIRGVTNLKEKAGYGERLSKAVQPYQALLSSKGLDAERAVQGMLNTYYQLETSQPQQRASLIRDLASRYGVDLTQIKPDPEADRLNSVLAPLHQEISRLRQHIEGQQHQVEQQTEQQKLDDANRVIEEFVSMTDEKGYPLHPYFHNVVDEMALYIQEGRATTLEQAYDKAVHADPTIRSILDADKAKREDEKRKAEAKARADKARKANKLNVSRRGSHDTKQPAPTGSLDDTLNSTYESLVAQ
jgi:hypothetical protein